MANRDLPGSDNALGLSFAGADEPAETGDRALDSVAVYAVDLQLMAPWSEAIKVLRAGASSFSVVV
jgi:hypothetical protein